MSPLEQALSTAWKSLPAHEPVAVALSGGLDSWVLALLLLRAGFTVHGYSLVTNLPGYCEHATVAALSAQFSLPVEPLPAPDLAAALPRFLAITQTPIYNLHPVSKLLLAESLAARAIPRVVTGDGADQVFRCETECDLLPLTQACFRHANVELVTPFLAPEVRALCTEPDPDKRPLRALAAALGLPAIPKRPTLVPGPSILEATRELLCAASRE